tara:strand:- start:332 stop:694 length:363 start_codon:yes stop_codon:yes gene_type:complete
MYSSAKKLPSVELLKERFEVDSSSPTGLKYKSNVGKKIKAGQVAGNYATSGTSGAEMYLVGYNRSKLQVHRVIWKMLNGKDPDQVIDHIDNNPLNNNISNLRDVTQRENLLNRKDRKISA